MFKSKIWIFILLALAALVLQLLVSQGRLSGSKCCPRSGPDLLMGYPAKSDPGGSR
jgi:hypothetical protein